MSRSLSSPAASSRNGLWPEFSNEPNSKGTGSKKQIEQFIGLSFVNDYAKDKVKKKTEIAKRAIPLDKQKTSHNDASEDEVDAYLPRNFCSMRGSKVRRAEAKEIALTHKPEGNSNMEVSSGCVDTLSGGKDSEDDIFSEEILNFARDSFRKRHRKSLRRKEKNRSPFQTPFEEKSVPIDSN